MLWIKCERPYATRAWVRYLEECGYLTLLRLGSARLGLHERGLRLAHGGRRDEPQLAAGVDSAIGQIRMIWLRAYHTCSHKRERFLHGFIPSSLSVNMPCLGQIFVERSRCRLGAMSTEVSPCNRVDDPLCTKQGSRQVSLKLAIPVPAFEGPQCKNALGAESDRTGGSSDMSVEHALVVLGPSSMS